MSRDRKESCTAQVEPGLSAAVVAEMRRLASVECPEPPPIPVLDGVWYVGAYGTVVAVSDRMVAVRRDNPKDWLADTAHLVMSITGRASNDGIKGDAVIVGSVDDLLVARFFQSPVGPRGGPAVGDEASVDYATSHELRASWRAGQR